MSFTEEILNQLQGLGNERLRDVYIKHGATQNTYGVSFENLRKLAKGLRGEHDIAVELFETQNTDAQYLATMILDPQELSFAAVSKWVSQLNYYMVVEQLTAVVARADFAHKALKVWTQSNKEYVKQAGFSLLGHMLKYGVSIPLADINAFLQQIEKEIQNSKNRARMAMNNALIAIGVFSPLYDEALMTARKIGRIHVDHGQTNCKTPNAEIYIKKVRARNSKGKTI